jgi:hypothetical protein
MSGATFLRFIDNRFVPSPSKRYFDKRSLVDGSLVGTVAEGGQPEVHGRALRRSRDHPIRVDRGSLILGYAGVYSSFLLFAQDAAQKYGDNIA